MLKYFLENETISKHQFGFLPGNQHMKQFLRTVQQIHSAINGKKLMGMLLLDVAKAINHIDHEILYTKTHVSGFSDNVIRWFRSYLN